jgi:phage head maturation protease
MKLYGTIEKTEQQEDGTIVVTGYASSEDVDSQGEIVTSKAMADALPDYMKFANIREMHQPKAAGVALEAAVQDDGRTWIKAHIVDDEAVKKVQTKVYKGFSIGGKVTGRDDSNKAIITGVKLSEISLVDRPANPSATFEMWKGDIENAPKTAAEAETTDKTEESPKEEDKPEEKPEEKADTATDIKKGMYSVAQLASILDQLSWLEECCEAEAMMEGDNSPVPGQLGNAVKALAGILRNMVAEETAEITAEEGNETIEMADKARDLGKAGARHSKADMDKLQAIHDHSAAMGADCATGKAQPTEDLTKLADMQEQLTKLAEQNNTLIKRVEELEALPQPPKAIVKAFEKENDSTLTKKEAAQADPLSLIKMAHQGGGKQLF